MEEVGGVAIAHPDERPLHQRPDIRPMPAAETRNSRSEIVRLLKSEVIPKLLISCGRILAAPNQRSTLRRPEVSSSASLVDHLTSSLFGSDAGAAWTIVETVLREGMTAETVLIELLGPVARRLGEIWEADACDFVQVTIGLHRLQIAMNGLLADYSPGSQPGTGFRILLAPAPGETHVIGLDIAQRFFRSGGWEVERAEAEGVAEALASQRFRCDRLLHQLSSLRRPPKPGNRRGSASFAQSLDPDSRRRPGRLRRPVDCNRGRRGRSRRRCSGGNCARTEFVGEERLRVRI